MKRAVIVALACALAGCGESTNASSSSPKSTECVVNGFGNELCDDAARAYCDIVLPARGSDSYEACRSVGWDSRVADHTADIVDAADADECRDDPDWCN